MYTSPSGAGYPPPNKSLWQKFLDWTGTGPTLGQTPQQQFNNTVGGTVVNGTKQVYTTVEKVVQALNDPVTKWVAIGMGSVILLSILRRR